MKWIIWAVAVVAAAFGAVTLASATPAPSYRLAPVTTGNVTQTVSTSGTVDHVNRADLSFGTEGTLATVPAPGDKVTAGQELATVDTTELAAAVDQAAADLAAAEDAAEESDAAESAQGTVAEAMAAAQAALARQVTVCGGPPSPACTAAMTETQTAQEAVAAALQEQQKSSSGPSGSMEVAAASAALVEAEQALAGASVVSPINGTVATVSAEVGSPVTAGDPVIVVVGAGAAVVATTVPVSQLPSVAVGQEVAVTPAGAVTSVPGTVTSIGALPVPESDPVAYPVTITVAEPPPSMAPGTSATAAITVATASEVLTVPTSAVTRGLVRVLDGEGTAMIPVTVGAVGPTRTEIKEGLAEGDQVVLADLNAALPTNDTPQMPGEFTVGGPGGGVQMRMGK